MKYAIVFSLVAFTFSSYAGTCKLSANYYEGFHCATISTKINTASEQECRTYAENSRDDKFFGVLTGKYERVLRTKYVYKDGKRKIKDMIEFEDYEEVCF